MSAEVASGLDQGERERTEVERCLRSDTFDADQGRGEAEKQGGASRQPGPRSTGLATCALATKSSTHRPSRPLEPRELRLKDARVRPKPANLALGLLVLPLKAGEEAFLDAGARKVVRAEGQGRQAADG